MKTNRMLVVAFVFVWAVGRVMAQDPLVAAPEAYRLLFENDRVRVMEVTIKPGQKVAPHSHPDHYVYVVEAGKIRISESGGTSTEADLQVGQVLWLPAVTHWAENIGTTTVRLVVNELKEAAPNKPVSP